MAPNATLKTSFNLLVVHDNVNDKNQDPDLNLFINIVWKHRPRLAEF